jgi:hypothetical protein
MHVVAWLPLQAFMRMASEVWKLCGSTAWQ